MSVDVETWRAKIEAKRATTARFRAINESAEHPAKPPRVRVAPIKRAPVTYRRATIRPCDVCSRSTRPSGTNLAQHPNTLQRKKGDTCQGCWWESQRTPDMQRRSKGIDTARIVELYATGMGCPQIAALLGCHKTSVRGHLIGAGVVLRSRVDAARLAVRS